MSHDHRTMAHGRMPCHCAITRLADLGTFHAIRENAAGVREMVEADLAAGLVAVLDFEGVEAITNGYADELVAKLREQHGDRVRWEGSNPDVEETIQTALARRATPTPRS